jgi:hypothetical protein
MPIGWVATMRPECGLISGKAYWEKEDAGRLRSLVPNLTSLTVDGRGYKEEVMFDRAQPPTSISPG